MPFALLVIGAALVIAGIRGQAGNLFSLVKGDLEGGSGPNQHGFLVWFAAILLIGALGYIPDLKTVSRALLVLVIIVLLLSNKGFFAQLQQGILSTGQPQATIGSTGGEPVTGIGGL